MTKIAEILAAGPTHSYEFFPPKNEVQTAQLETAISELAATNPGFISITYGALGSTQETTRDIAIAQNRRPEFPTMAHLTCVGQSREAIGSLIGAYSVGGVENILALRGDGDEPGGFGNAIDLATFIKDRKPSMSVGVAAHPELHPSSASRAQDRQHLAAKLEVADFAITQFFFDASHYHRLVEELDALRSNKPIIPGIMLFASSVGLRKMAGMNNTSLPKALTDQLDSFQKPEDVQKLAVETAAKLVQDLRADYDLPGMHFYTLNRSAPALELRDLLGQGI
jgi:methylenetetrahydrofolate reductase (NADPH)